MKEPEKQEDFIEIEVETLKIFLEKTFLEKYKEDGEIKFKIPSRGEFILTLQK